MIKIAETNTQRLGHPLVLFAAFMLDCSSDAISDSHTLRLSFTLGFEPITLKNAQLMSFGRSTTH